MMSGANRQGPGVARRLLAAMVLAVLPIRSALAQDAPGPRRVAVDTVVGWQNFLAEDADWPQQVILDAFVGIEVAPGWQASIRPVAWRVNGEWEALLDQVSLRREFRSGINWRVEVGRFPSAIGLGMTENRATINPGVIWCHRPYYMPLPASGGGLPLVSLVSAVYPDGAQVAASGDVWDARVVVADRAPVQFWRETPGSARGVNVVAGGGVSPVQGVRVGAAFARGPWADAAGGHGRLDYTMANVEADLTIGYTRVSGEWTRDRFETPAGPLVASGWTAQVQHTISPRVFVHSRASRLAAPSAGAGVAGPAAGRTRYVSVDTTVGYRVTPAVTARLAYSVVRRFQTSSVDHQFGASLMWAMRWW